MADIDGTSGDDVIDGGFSSDTIKGLSGDDVLNGGDGDDDLYGGPGDDVLNGNGGWDDLYGGSGADILNGGDGNDDLDGEAGADTLDGGPGWDRVDYQFSDAGVTIDLSAPTDANGYVRGAGGFAEGDRLRNIEHITGSDYADRLKGDHNDNDLVGGDGDDDLDGGDGNNDLDGGPGDDVLYGGPGDDKLIGREGNDTLNGGPGNDDLYGRDDGFFISQRSESKRFVFDAGSGNDVIMDFNLDYDMIEIRQTGIGFADLQIETNRGNALITWNDGDQSITLNGVDDADLTADHFLFNPDAPVIVPGTDAITGTAGADTLNGTAGADTINGLAGNDTLNGGPGADALIGGPGADTASYLNSDVGVLVRLHDARAVKFGHAEGDTLTGIEHLIGSRHNDTLAGDGGDNRLEGHDGNDLLYGGPAGGDDLMYGGNGDDRIFGGRGNDTLTGGAGFDYLRGGPGDDDLVAGEGMDVMYGGTGQDTFIFSPSNVGGALIADFSNGEDKIDLTAFAAINSMNDLDIISHGDNVRIDASGSDYLTTIILADFDINNLDNSDFLF